MVAPSTINLARPDPAGSGRDRASSAAIIDSQSVRAADTAERGIFTQRLAGRSIAKITRELNEREVPCPSRADRRRNPHRSGTGWMLTTVAAILANPPQQRR